MTAFFRFFAWALPMTLASTPLLAGSCKDLDLGICSRVDASGAYDANAKSCMESLLACGQYKELISLADRNVLGLDRHYNFYLGAAYFGLSGRTDAQSLRCYYTKRSSVQLQEFLIKTEAMNSSSVTYGSDSEMDMLYFAARDLENLKNEPGCFESSYAEGTLFLKAKADTFALMRGLLQDSDPKGTSTATTTVRTRFQAIRNSLNTFVTTAAQIEERVSAYHVQIGLGHDTVQNVVTNLQTAFPDGAISYSNETGSPILVINNQKIDEKMEAIASKVSGWESNLRSTESSFDDFILKSKTKGYYDQLRDSNMDRIDTLSKEATAAINIFGNSEGRKKELIDLSKIITPPDTVELTLKSIMKDYQTAINTKNKCDWPSGGWFCPTE